MTAPDPSPKIADRLAGTPSMRGPRPLATLALAIGLATLLGDQVFSLVRLSSTRTELQAARAAQEPQLEQARRIEQQLDALATGTSQLAAQGNQNAAAILATLQAQGVTINQPAKTQQ